MRYLVILVLTAFLSGCSAAPPKGLLTYLRQSAPYQTALGQLLQEMKGIPKLPVLDRGPAARVFIQKVHSQRTGLEALVAPPAASKYQADLVSLYTILENYAAAASSGSGDPGSPVLVKLAAQWGEQYKTTDADLDSLSKLTGQ